MSDEFDTPGVDDEGIRRDRWGRYMLPSPSDGQVGPYTRVTTLVSGVDDSYLLNQWKLRNVAYGVAHRSDLTALAAAAELTDRKVLTQVVEEASEFAGANSRARLGTSVHKFCEMHDRNQDFTAPELLAAEVEAYKQLVERYGLEFIEIERVVLNTRVKAAGKPDRIARITRELTFKHNRQTIRIPVGTLMILDLKTGGSLDYGQGAIAAQLAVYSRATHLWKPGHYRGMHAYSTMPAVDQQWGLVVHIPVRTNPDDTVVAELRPVDLVAGWGAAKLAYQLRTWRTDHKKLISAPITVPEPAAIVVKDEKPRFVNGEMRTLKDVAEQAIDPSVSDTMSATAMQIIKNWESFPEARECHVCGKQFGYTGQSDLCVECTTLMFSRVKYCPSCGRQTPDGEICENCRPVYTFNEAIERDHLFTAIDMATCGDDLRLVFTTAVKRRSWSVPMARALSKRELELKLTSSLDVKWEEEIMKATDEDTIDTLIETAPCELRNRLMVLGETRADQIRNTPLGELRVSGTQVIQPYRLGELYPERDMTPDELAGTAYPLPDNM